MNEDFLHYVWRTKQFQFLNLSTTDGQPVEILDFGQWNHDAGPDFSMARLLIDNTQWIGHIEIHVSASDWNHHGHSDDPAYANVILHVVLEHETDIYCMGRKIPAIELKSRISPALLSRYLRLSSSASVIPCASHLHEIPDFIKEMWLGRMSLERLEVKSTDVYLLLNETQYNWFTVFYRMLGVAFGFKTNAQPFRRLASLVPINTVQSLADNTRQLHALFFGVAGFLNRIFHDSYAVDLQREFEHLKNKYDLSIMGMHEWKWGRMRPANFPSFRIAQFVALLPELQELYESIIGDCNVDTIPAFFGTSIPDYWNSHTDFDKTCRPFNRTFGEDSVRGLLINSVAPFLYVYGREHGNNALVQRSTQILESLAGEQNRITRSLTALNMPNQHAGQSQGLIHLKRAYCDHRKCTECAIGSEILKS